MEPQLDPLIGKVVNPLSSGGNADKMENKSPQNANPADKKVQDLMEEWEMVVPPKLQPQEREIPFEKLIKPLAEPSKRAHPEPAREDYLNHFFVSIGQIVNTVIDVVHEKDMSEGVKKLQAKAPEFPKLAKAGANLFLSVGLGVNDKFQRLVDEYELNKEPSEAFLKAIDWLTTDEHKLAEGQLAALIANFNHLNLREGLEIYKKPVIEWLLADPTKRPPLAKFLNLHQNQLKECKDTLREIVKFLLESKVEQLTKRFVDNLGDKFPENLKNYLKEQVNHIARLELEKVGDIIHAMTLNWTQFIDGIVLHLRDFAIATNKSALAKEKAITPLKGNKDEIEQVGNSHMQAVYVRSAPAHPITREVEHHYNMAHYETAIARRDTMENDLMNAHFQKVFDILFAPDKRTLRGIDPKKDDKRSPDQKSVDFWKDQLELPEPFQPLVKQANELANELVNPEVMKFFTEVPAWLKTDVQDLIISRIKAFIAKQVISEILTKLDRFTDPDKITELMAKKILPAVVPVLIGAITKHGFVEIIKDPKRNPRENEALAERLYKYHTVYRNWKAAVDKNDQSDAGKATLQELQGAKDKEILSLKNFLSGILQQNKIPLEFSEKQLDKAFAPVIKDLDRRMSDITTELAPKVLMGYLEQSYKNEEDNSPISRLKHAFPEVLGGVRNLEGYFSKLLLDPQANKDSLLIEVKNQFVEKIKKHLSKADVKALSEKQIDEQAKRFVEDLYDALTRVKNSQREFNQRDVAKFFADYLQGLKNAKSNLSLYADLLDEVVQMTTLGGFLKTASGIGGFIYEKIVDKLAKNIRNTPEFLFNVLADELPEALDHETFMDLIYTPPSASKEPLRRELRELNKDPVKNKEAIANHELNQQEAKFNENMLNVATLAHRLVYIMIEDMKKDSTALKLIDGRIYATIGTPKELAENITKVYKRILGSQFRTKDIVYKLLDFALGTLHGQWITLNPSLSPVK